MKEINEIDKRIQREVRLKDYLGPDRIVYADDLLKELEEQHKRTPPFLAKSGLETLDETTEGFRKGQLVVLSGPPKNGKCHGRGTKILLFDGSIKNVEDVVVGDFLMGVDSLPRRVQSLAQGREMIYQVEQRGEPYSVNESHILSLQMTGTKKRTPKVKGRVVNISVREYLNKSATFKHHAKGWKTGVEWGYQSIPLDPYFLGLWLGDGTSKQSSVTTADKEIVDYLTVFANKNNWKIAIDHKKDNAAKTYRISGSWKKTALVRIMRSMKVLGNKRIPKNYLINNKAIRLEILAGIIDTDGHLASVKGYDCYDIIQKSKNLSDDIVFLARSCGFSATITSCTKTISSRGFKGTYYRIRIGGEINKIPVKIERKKSARVPKKNTLRTNITLKKMGIGDYFGFTLDGDGLYLLGDFTVTHNSQLAATFTVNFWSQHRCLWFQYELGQYDFLSRFPKNIQEKIDFYTPKQMYANNLDWVEDRIVEAKQKNGTDIVFIDHLDFVRDPSVLRNLGGGQQNTATYVGSIVQKIKRMAVENDVVIFLLSHITKNEWTTNELPKSEQLRDSGQIAQLADIVLMIIRKRLDKSQDEIYHPSLSLLGVMENRHNGRTKKIPLVYDVSGKIFTETDWAKWNFDEKGNGGTGIRNQRDWVEREDNGIWVHDK